MSTVQELLEKAIEAGKTTMEGEFSGEQRAYIARELRNLSDGIALGTIDIITVSHTALPEAKFKIEVEFQLRNELLKTLLKKEVDL